LVTSVLDQPRELRAGVIGAGAFGRLHAQKYASLPGVKLVGVADVQTANAEKLAGDFMVQAFSGWRLMLPHVDVVTIAVPARFHGEIGVGCLNLGKHILMEKPLAANLREADALVRVAEQKGLVLHTGHQERFVMRALGLFDGGPTPLKVESHRAAPYNPRNTDVSVVHDLMIHDIDLVHQLNDTPVVDVRASERTLAHWRTDEVSADLRFADGMRVELFASRMAEARKRYMRIVYPDGEIFIDFLTREMRNTTPRKLHALGSVSGLDGMPCPSTDPLGHSVAQFVSAVRHGKPAAIGPREARLALQTALAILDAAKAAAPQKRVVHA
jgi:predicted dehydrogenase